MVEYDDFEVSPGLCPSDCEEGRCRWSWPSDDQFKWKSDAVIARCMPQGVQPYDYENPDPAPGPDPDPTPDPDPPAPDNWCFFDYTALSYGDLCGEKHNKEECASCAADACHMSWPASDPNFWYSQHAKCRCLPSDYAVGSFSYGEPVIADYIDSVGLCGINCEAGRCRWSWPTGDLLQWKSDAIMPRCMPPGVDPVVY